MIAHPNLLGQLIKHDALLRYMGAMFCVAWVFLNPLIMLAIFAYVFGLIFQPRWPQQETGVTFFWLVLCLQRPDRLQHLCRSHLLRPACVRNQLC